VLGDVFEYAVLAAINEGDPQVLTMLCDALAIIKEPGEILGAVTAAAENGRTATVTLPPGCTVRTGRPGRPPDAVRLLALATTKDWKNDIFLVTSRGVVGATIKSNSGDMRKHLFKCRHLPHPPRLGIVPVTPSYGGIVRDDRTGTPIVRLPTDVPLIALLHSALTSIQAALASRLEVPGTALSDPQGIRRQLNRWKNLPVVEVIEILDDAARIFRGALQPSTAVEVEGLTGVPTDGQQGLVVAIPAFLTPDDVRGLGKDWTAFVRHGPGAQFSID
jgi:hypothetical protein